MKSNFDEFMSYIPGGGMLSSVLGVDAAFDELKKDQRFGSAKLASNLITIAYQRAKTLDPNGRISDRDFKAALESITSSFLASNQISKALLMGFKADAESQLVINENLLEVFTNIDSNDNNVILKKNIRAIRAVPVFKRVRQMVGSINAVREYRDRYAEAGNRVPRVYSLDIVQSHNTDQLGISDDLQIYQVVRRTNTRDPIAIGLPVYTDKYGKMLTSKELTERGFRQ